MQAVLLAILAPLMLALGGALMITALRRLRHKPAPMPPASGDAPCFPRGGYAALDEQAPIQARRPS